MSPEPNAAPHQSTIRDHIAASTILQTQEQVLGTAAEDSVIFSAQYQPEAAINGAASPASRTLTIVNRGQAGAGTNVLATLALVAGVTGAKDQAIPFVVSVDPVTSLISKGDDIVCVSTPVGGTGMVDPGGEVTVVSTRNVTQVTPTHN
jgi:hypothetical protein